MAAEAPEDRLESWKEIAAFLRRDVRTVQRWEKAEGLPVHRHFHDKQGSVFALRSELERWQASRVRVPEEEPAVSGEPSLEPEAEEVPKDDKGRRLPWRGWVLGLAGTLLLALGGWAAWRFLAPVDRGIVLAVMPFENLDGSGVDDFFTDGLTEELITQLRRQLPPGVRILAMGSTRPYKRSPKRIGQIARELGATQLFLGRVRRSEDHVRITAHLVKGRDETEGWSEVFDAPVGDALAIQAQVAEHLARSLSLALRPSGTRSHPTPSQAAAEPFMKGRFFFGRRTPLDLFKALAFYQEALRLDPAYAPAHVGVANCLALLGSAEMGAMAPAQAMPAARAALERALVLDPDLAEAHATLAYIKLIHDWDWPGSEAEFRRAIHLDPNLATAHQWYALLLSVLGRSQEALVELARAEAVDPLSPVVKTALSECHYFARDFDRAETAARAAMELDPAFMLAHVNLGRARAQKGDLAGAARIFKAAWEQSGRGPGLAMLLGHTYARMGDRARAQEMLEALRHPPVYGGRPLPVPSLYFAAIHAALKEREATFRYLDRALDERCEYLVYLRRDPMADELRQDPRFRALMGKVGLPEK
ncbi:MAG TPA: tetratricopeptide repeat protein [Holophaga sp.]|nr:tetratricopeptide repeat protein [Holophaga sp.]